MAAQRRPRRVAGLVLAAGAGRRFGAPKQLAELDGRPLLEHALSAMTAARGVGPVAVALGARADEVRAGVDLHGATPVVVEDWEEGAAASLRAGVRALAPLADAIVVTLGDQPRVGALEIERVLDAAAAAGAPAARAAHGGVPGHPAVIGRALFDAVLRLHGDTGARRVLEDAGALTVELGPGAVLDVDTPAQLDALRGGA